MNTAAKLDPIVSEFDTVEDAVSYDKWFRAKVEKAMKSTKPAIPHDEVVARMRKKMAERLNNEG